MRELQSEKAPDSIVVTLIGILTDVNLEHPQKASLPMVATLFPIVNFVKPEQP